MDIDEFSEAIKYDTMDRIYQLQTQLMTNVLEIDAIETNIQHVEVTTPDDLDTLEDLYQKAFKLYMNNLGLSEDLVLAIEREPKNQFTEFELAKIKKQAKDMCLVSVIE